MPKVFLKNILAEIRSNFGRFLSIMAIVALGVAFFAAACGSKTESVNSNVVLDGVELKKTSFHRRKMSFVDVSGGGLVGVGLSKGGQKIQTFSYRVRKYWV